MRLQLHPFRPLSDKWFRDCHQLSTLATVSTHWHRCQNCWKCQDKNMMWDIIIMTYTILQWYKHFLGLSTLWNCQQMQTLPTLSTSSTLLHLWIKTIIEILNCHHITPLPTLLSFTILPNNNVWPMSLSKYSFPLSKSLF